MNEGDQALEQSGRTLRQAGISKATNGPINPTLDSPPAKVLRMTWVRTSELYADLTLMPGVSREDITEALEAGMFADIEILNPATDERLATVGEVETDNAEDNGFVVEKM